MSRRIETRHYTPREHEVVVAIACDLCGREQPTTRTLDDPRPFARGDWGSGSFAREEITVEHKKGDHYPEGGSDDVTSFDLCPICWETVLLPFLQERGAKPHVERADW